MRRQLPVGVRQFVGREHELAVVRLLSSDGSAT
jgi:hypothetical protein